MIGNVLAMAQKIIPPVDILYYKFNTSTIDDYGAISPSFDTPITIKANVHPVPRSVYQEQGLDFNKQYISIFTQQQMFDLDRDNQSDKIEYLGEMYQLFNKSDWTYYNGWNSFKAVRIDR